VFFCNKRIIVPVKILLNFAECSCGRILIIVNSQACVELTKDLKYEKFHSKVNMALGHAS
jgi:hypothetical protein